MKKYLLLVIVFSFFISCTHEEEILEKRVLKFQTIAANTFAIAEVKNTFDTVINTDTVKAGQNSYTWDELDNNGIQVATGLYLITVTYKGNEIASGSYVVGQ